MYEIKFITNAFIATRRENNKTNNNNNNGNFQYCCNYSVSTNNSSSNSNKNSFWLPMLQLSNRPKISVLWFIGFETE